MFSRIRLDGTPRLIIPLGECRAAGRIQFCAQAVHEIVEDAFGNAKSSWKLHGVNAFIAARKEDELVWHGLNGNEIVFPRPTNIGAWSRVVGVDFIYRTRGDLGEDILTRDGVEYTFVDGVLSAILSPNGDEYRCESKDGRIRRIFMEGPDLRTEVLEVRFGRQGAIEQVSIGKCRARLYWNESRVLQRIDTPEGAQLVFEYEGGVLMRIAENGKIQQSYQWRVRPEYRRARSPYPLPVSLAADIDSSYEFGVSRRGYVLERLHNRRKVEVTVNPQRSMLSIRELDRVANVRFRLRGDWLQLE